MFLHSMPFLVINLGGEMMYILEQRLGAQNIDSEKSKKVLKDITKTMFGNEFINELMKPQSMYSISSTKEIFDKLAHCSIMRLSAVSMNKLYDLMLMGYKYQLLQCKDSREIAQMTFNHLDFFSKIMGTDKVSCIAETITKVTKVVKEMKFDDFEYLKEDLLNFVKDKNVKVGLFLTKELQDKRGCFKMYRSPNQIGYSSEKSMGIIEYFSNVESSSIKNLVIQVDQFEHPLAQVKQNVKNFNDLTKRCSNVGMNMYAKDFNPNIENDGEKGKGSSFNVVPAKKSSRMYMYEKKEDEVKVSKDSNLLAKMLGGVIDETKGEQKDDGFKLKLDWGENHKNESDDEKDEKVEKEKIQLERRDKVVNIHVTNNMLLKKKSIWDDEDLKVKEPEKKKKENVDNDNGGLDLMDLMGLGDN